MSHALDYAIGAIIAIVYVWCFRVLVVWDQSERFWPFKLRDLPSTKNRLLREVAE